jgi:hypothetical protein
MVVITIKCVYLGKVCMYVKHFHILYILGFIFYNLYCILTTSDSSGSVGDSSNLMIVIYLKMATRKGPKHVV